MAHAALEPMRQSELRHEWSTDTGAPAQMSTDPKDWNLTMFRKGSKSWAAWRAGYIQHPHIRTRLIALTESPESMEVFRHAVDKGLNQNCPCPNPGLKWPHPNDAAFCVSIANTMYDMLRADACPGFDSTDLRAVGGGGLFTFAFQTLAQFTGAGCTHRWQWATSLPYVKIMSGWSVRP